MVRLVELGFLDDADLFEAIADAADGGVDAGLQRLEALLERPRVHPAVGAGAAALRVGLLLRSRRTTRAVELLPDLLNRVAPQRMLLVLTIGMVGGAGFLRLLEADARRLDGHPFATEALERLGRYGRPSRGGTRLSVETGEAPQLTPRERDVLGELSLGGSYADVAAAMFLSENTVKTHLTSAYRKLGVERRVDALRVARENHLL